MPALSVFRTFISPIAYVPSTKTNEVFVPVLQEEPLLILYSQDTASDAGVTVTVPSLFGLGVGNVTVGCVGGILYTRTCPEFVPL